MIMIIKMIEIYNTALLLLAYYIETIAPHAPLRIYRLKEGALLPAMFNPLFGSTNQKLFKKNFYQLKTISVTNGSHHVQSMVNKDEWTQRRAVVSPWRMHCVYNDMAKGTSWAEATLNSKKIKPVALTIVELRESEGIRQAVS